MIPLTDDRARINAGKLVGARLLIEANVYNHTTDDNKPEWVIEGSLFSSEGGDIIGREQVHCVDCTRSQFLAKLPSFLTRLLAHDDKEPTAELIVQTEPAVRGHLRIDEREMGELPFKETLFIGKHRVAVEANGFRPASVDVVLEKGRAANITLRLESSKSTPEDHGSQTSAPTAPPRPSVVPTPPRSRALTIAGATLVGVGGVGLILGIVDLALDGHGTCSLGASEQLCPSTYDTKVPGGVLVGLGSAAAVTGAILLIIDAKQNRTPATRLNVGISQHSAMLELSGRF